jgi:hypothetical protein
MYNPSIRCSVTTIDQFNAETNRFRAALAAGIPFSMYTLRGWELKNSGFLSKEVK